MEELIGSTPDIISLPCLHFWEPVYRKLGDSDFPSESTERMCCFVGIFENVGHTLTFKILIDDAKRDHP